MKPAVKPVINTLNNNNYIIFQYGLSLSAVVMHQNGLYIVY